MNELNQVNATLAEIQKQVADLQKVVATSDTAFPVRENLAAEAKIVIPVDTPLLRRFPQKQGSGKASAWKEITSFGTDPSSVFYAEGGAPSGRTTVYADRSETYKQVGLDGGVTGLAIAAGANYQDQLASEKRNTMLHLKRLEESALLNAAATGNEFSGLRTQITTANGAFVQAATTGTVPASTVTKELDDMIQSAWDKGGSTSVFVVTSSGARKISDAIVKQNANVLQVNVNTQVGISGGFFVNRYISPLTGEQIEIIPDKFHTATECLGLCEQMPAPVAGQGGDAIDLDVLLDYAMADVPTANDQKLFRILRYYVLRMPGRKFCGKLTSF